jgi:hypothetical protein
MQFNAEIWNIPMVKETLLNSDVEIGERVLQTLDASGFPVSVALWVRKGDEERSRLLLASPLYDKLGEKKAYLRLVSAVAADKQDWMPLRLTSTRDPLIRDLRKIYGKSANVEGMWLRSKTLGGVWIDEGYVYRIR